jgi:hypothetical protein
LLQQQLYVEIFGWCRLDQKSIQAAALMHPARYFVGDARH